MAVPTEVKGSRKEWEDAFFKYGEMWFVGSSVADAPVAGWAATNFTDAAGVTDTTDTRRKYLNRAVDDDIIPGLYLFRVRFKGFQPYTSS